MFGPPIATAAVLLSIVVLVLAYYGYVNLNWRTVTTAFTWGLDVNRDGHVGLSDAKAVAGRVYSFVIGFVSLFLCVFVVVLLCCAVGRATHTRTQNNTGKKTNRACRRSAATCSASTLGSSCSECDDTA